MGDKQTSSALSNVRSTNTPVAHVVHAALWVMNDAEYGDWDAN
jgi:hypothetical protein